jgi:Leucine-rich repeat (LRR) protein
VFEIPAEEGDRLIDITIDKAKKDYIIPQKVKDIYKKEKEILSLIEENLDDESVKIMQGSKDGMDHIRNMELADNKLTSIHFIANNFPNLQRLQLSRNRIENIDGVARLTHITKLNLRDNRLTNLPD